MAAKKNPVAKKKGSSKKKTGSGKRKNRRKVKKPSVTAEIKKILVGLAVLVSVCLTVAMVADIFLKPDRLKPNRPEPDKPQVSEPDDRIKPIQEDVVVLAKEKKKSSGLKTKKTIAYEVFDDVEHTIVDKPIKPVKAKIPQIAIIIDDIGYDRKVALALCDLNSDITFSVLPFSPYGRVIADKLHAKGAQLMLHLPMEPVEYPRANPGPGALLSSMPPDVLLGQLKKNIKDVPHIVGVNNHMGSDLTSRSNQMNQIFTILKKRELFFIDSRTAPKSQCMASARLFKLPFAQRDVFLDNIQEFDYITGQLKELIGLAKKHGSAIGIGHPYKATLQTLSKQLPKLKNRVKIVRASHLTHIPG